MWIAQLASEVDVQVAGRAHLQGSEKRIGQYFDFEHHNGSASERHETSGMMSERMGADAPEMETGTRGNFYIAQCPRIPQLTKNKVKKGNLHDYALVKHIRHRRSPQLQRHV
jgi:hypothetical protein